MSYTVKITASAPTGKTLAEIRDGFTRAARVSNPDARLVSILITPTLTADVEIAATFTSDTYGPAEA